MEIINEKLIIFVPSTDGKEKHQVWTKDFLLTSNMISAIMSQWLKQDQKQTNEYKTN